MTTRPDLSVIMPLYNAEQSVAESIRSVLDHADGLLELIVVDDGSTDTGPAIASTFGDPVRVIHQANAGQAVARNHGIAEARGDLIGFLDADDLWVAGTPDPRRASLADPEVDIAQGWVQEVAGGRPLTNRPPGAAGQVGTMLARRSVFTEIGGFDPAAVPSEDIEWFLRVRDAGAVIAVVPAVVVHYRRDRAKHVATHEQSKADLSGFVRASLARRRAAAPD